MKIVAFFTFLVLKIKKKTPAKINDYFFHTNKKQAFISLPPEIFYPYHVFRSQSPQNRDMTIRSGKRAVTPSRLVKYIFYNTPQVELEGAALGVGVVGVHNLKGSPNLFLLLHHLII